MLTGKALGQLGGEDGGFASAQLSLDLHHGQVQVQQQKK